MRTTHHVGRSARVALTALALAVTIGGLSACGDDSAATATTGNATGAATGAAAFDKTSLGAVPSIVRFDPAADRARRSFVGVDAKGTALGISINGDHAVAYLCDGAAVSTWFTGTANGDSLQLTAADGSALTASVAGDKLSGNHGGTAFSLTSAAGGAGVFRDITDAPNGKLISGWVVGNDGSIVGITSDEQGGKAASVALPPASPSGNGSDDGVGNTTPTTAEPVPLTFLNNLECGILAARFNFNHAHGGSQDQRAVLIAKANRANCLAFGGTS